MARRLQATSNIFLVIFVVTCGYVTKSNGQEGNCVEVQKECFDDEDAGDNCCKSKNKPTSCYDVEERGLICLPCLPDRESLSIIAFTESKGLCDAEWRPCCNKNLTCIDQKCLSKTALCIGGSPNPITPKEGSEGRCEIESNDPAAKCCRFGDNEKKAPGVCIDGGCKCIADGESCTSADVCCNEGKDTLTCRNGKCATVSKEELKECMTGRLVTDPYPAEKCKVAPRNPKEMCCRAGDNYDKSAGQCSSYGLCLCSNDGEFCTNSVCCNEGKNGISCRRSVNDMKCLKASETTKCKDKGELCNGIFGTCCSPYWCKPNYNRFERTVCV